MVQNVRLHTFGEARSVFEQAFKNIDDILRKEVGCTTELDYTEQISWLLFLGRSLGRSLGSLRESRDRKSRDRSLRSLGSLGTDGTFSAI
jgi:hypothetical protein